MVVFRVNEKFLEGLFDSVVVINRKIKQSILTSLKKDRFLLLCLSNQIYCSKNIHLNLVFKVIQEYLAPFAKVLVFLSNVHPNKSSPLFIKYYMAGFHFFFQQFLIVMIVLELDQLFYEI